MLAQEWAIATHLRWEQVKISIARAQTRARGENSANQRVQRNFVPDHILGAQRRVRRMRRWSAHLAARFGTGSVFTTATANPKWQNLEDGPIYDNPLAGIREQKRRLTRLLDRVEAGEVYGEHAYTLARVEDQQRDDARAL